MQNIRRKILYSCVIILSLFIVATVAGLLWLSFSDLNRFKGFAETRLSESFGEAVTINGDFAVDFSFRPSLRVSDVNIDNIGNVGEFHIQVSLLSLFGRLIIHDLVVKDTNLSWQAKPKKESRRDSKSEVSIDDVHNNLPIIYQAVIDNVTLHYIDNSKNQDFSASIDGNINITGERDTLQGNINLRSANVSVTQRLPDVLFLAGQMITVDGCILIDAPISNGIIDLQKSVAVTNHGTAKSGGTINVVGNTIDAFVDIAGYSFLQGEAKLTAKGALSKPKYASESVSINLGKSLDKIGSLLEGLLTEKTEKPKGLQACEQFARQ